MRSAGAPQCLSGAITPVGQERYLVLPEIPAQKGYAMQQSKQFNSFKMHTCRITTDGTPSGSACNMHVAARENGNANNTPNAGTQHQYQHAQKMARVDFMRIKPLKAELVANCTWFAFMRFPTKSMLSAVFNPMWVARSGS